MLTVKPRKTGEGYLALQPESSFELHYGELLMAPSPSPRHQRIAIRIWKEIDGHARANRRGEALAAPPDVDLSDQSVVRPDVIFVAADRRSILTDARIEGAPTLIVEVLSPNSVDRDNFVK